MLEQVLKGTTSILLCYDLSATKPQESINKWMNLIEKASGSKLPLILIGTKSDLVSNPKKVVIVDDQILDNIIVSSKTQKGLVDVMETLTNSSYKNIKENS